MKKMKKWNFLLEKLKIYKKFLFSFFRSKSEKTRFWPKNLNDHLFSGRPPPQKEFRRGDNAKLFKSWLNLILGEHFRFFSQKYDLSIPSPFVSHVSIFGVGHVYSNPPKKKIFSLHIKGVEQLFLREGIWFLYCIWMTYPFEGWLPFLPELTILDQTSQKYNYCHFKLL